MQLWMRSKLQRECYTFEESFVGKLIIYLQFLIHTLESMQEDRTGARAEINRKAGIKEGTPAKRPKLDDLLVTPSSSTSAPTTPKASSSFGIGNLIDRMDVNEQNKLDVLLTRVSSLIVTNVILTILSFGDRKHSG
jgi:hypothetical protein